MRRVSSTFFCEKNYSWFLIAQQLVYTLITGLQTHVGETVSLLLLFFLPPRRNSRRERRVCENQKHLTKHLLRALLQCLLKEEKAASLGGCGGTLYSSPGVIPYLKHRGSWCSGTTLWTDCIRVRHLWGEGGAFTVGYQFFPTADDEAVTHDCFHWGHEAATWFFSLVLTRKSLKLSLDREPKIVTRRKGCQRCVLSPSLYVIYSKILNLWEQLAYSSYQTLFISSKFMLHLLHSLSVSYV